MNQKIPNILLVSLALILISSCRKKEIPPVEEPAIENPQVVTQPSSPTWLVIDSTSALITKLSLMPYPYLQESFGEGDYAIDLDGDGTKDIDIILSAAGGQEEKSSLLKVKTLGSTTTILTDSIYNYYNKYYDGSGSLISTDTIKVNKLYPVPLNYKDTLKLNGRWRSGTFTLSEYHQYWQYTANTHDDHWSNFAWPYNFLGVKCNNKLAWISLSSSLYKVEIRQAAISK
jgi:hypothetical protein